MTPSRPSPPERAAVRVPLDPRLLRHARTSRAGIALLALLGAGQAVVTLGVAVALSLLIGGGARWAVGALLIAYACRAALALGEQAVAHRTATRVIDELRRSLLRAAGRRGPAWAAEFGAGRLTAVLTGGLDALRPWFTGYLPALILGVALPPLVVVAIALADPLSALIAAATLPLVPLLGALIGWATQARAQQRWQADARLAGHFLDVVRGLPTLRMYARADRQTEVVAELTDEHRFATLRVLRVAFLSSTALDLVATLSVGLIAVSAGLRVAGGELTLGPALLVILLAPEAYRPLREMAARYHAATDATAAIADADEILRPPRLPTLRTPAGCPPPRLPAGAAPASAWLPMLGTLTEPWSYPEVRTCGRVGVVAHGLRARYPGAAADALNLPALTVTAGEIVALRGESGAGKTTALRVLAGLHPASAGTYTAEHRLYLPQRPTLPHARTVTDVFEPGTPTDDIQEALRATALDGDLTGATPLGEHGTGVSAGQRQRLALAALLHRAGSTPTTFLLDEPTAHLDPDTERLVIARLRRAAAAGCAILVVAHRPALLAAADRTVLVSTPSAEPLHASPASPAAAPATDAARIGAAPATDAARIAAARATDAARIAAAPHAAGSAVPGPAPGAAAPDIRSSSAWRRPWAAVTLGSAASLAALLLTGAAAWLLVRAAGLPPVLTLSAAVVLVRGSAVARPLLRYLERLVAHDVAFARLGARRAAVYAALIPRVPGPRLRRRGDLLTRVVDDVDARVDGLLRGRLPALSTAVTLVAAAGTIAWIAPAAVLPLAAGLLITGVLAPVTAERQAAREDAATAQARARVRDAMVETVAGLEELPGTDIPERRSRALARLESGAARAAGRAAAVAHVGWGVAVAGTAYALTHTAGLTPEWTAVVLLTVVALGEPALTLPDTAVARRRAAGAADRLAALTSQPPSVTFPAAVTGTAPLAGRPAAAFPIMDAPGSRRTSASEQVSRQRIGSISVRGLTAGWDSTVCATLRGLDLDLPAGARVAVTGRSGSGKSTLGAVLARLLDPRSGTITADGRDLRTLPEAAVRRRIVLVGEDTDHVFASTVRENLRLAAPAATDAELRDVLARVHLNGWLAGLPAGLDTWLGTGGSTMSGGQMRRLATARALLAEPELLILDEPTEGLDAETAAALMADLFDAAEHRTFLVLTHRPAGIARMDQVFALDGGRLRPARQIRPCWPATKFWAGATAGGSGLAEGKPDRGPAR
jgi:ATP-binding cassette subfamily C protein CydCD